jgi:transposase
MQLKTLLHRVHPVKGFVYEQETLVADPAQANGLRLEVTLRARRGARGRCLGCGRRGPTYDTGAPRQFAFVPQWGIAVTLGYPEGALPCHPGTA